jgi:hypothetical protein
LAINKYVEGNMGLNLMIYYVLHSLLYGLHNVEGMETKTKWLANAHIIIDVIIRNTIDIIDNG